MNQIVPKMLNTTKTIDKLWKLCNQPNLIGIEMNQTSISSIFKKIDLLGDIKFQSHVLFRRTNLINQTKRKFLGGSEEKRSLQLTNHVGQIKVLFDELFKRTNLLGHQQFL